mmetsp:Transcript_20956/g.17378  ORF Transcript_20956/g.17378 Transcript_20956/m.17378 type:complete len:114 (+) Transcript_20956:540-881(+)
MQGTALPDTEPSFESKNTLLFPFILDLKILVHPFDRFKGSLQKLADFFNIKRVGKLHNGGSDALTTSQVYFRVKSYLSKEDWELHSTRSLNIIWGLSRGFEYLKRNDGTYDTG